MNIERHRAFWHQKLEMYSTYVLPRKLSQRKLIKTLKGPSLVNNPSAKAEFVLHWGLTELATKGLDTERNTIFQATLANSDNSQSSIWQTWLQQVLSLIKTHKHYPSSITHYLLEHPVEDWSYQDRMSMILIMLSGKIPAFFEEEGEQAINILYKRHVERCLQHAQFLGVSYEDAPEVVHDALHKVYSSWSNPRNERKTRGIRSPKAYMDKVLYNCRNDYFRKKYRVCYKITEQSLEHLKSEDVPDDVLEKLEGIKGQEFRKEKNFLTILQDTIGEQRTVQYKSLILKHAKYREQKLGDEMQADHTGASQPSSMQEPAEVIMQNDFDAFAAEFPAEAEVLQLVYAQGIEPEELPDIVGQRTRLGTRRHKVVFTYKARKKFWTFCNDRTWTGFETLWPKHAEAIELVEAGARPEVLPGKFGKTAAEKRFFVDEAYRKWKSFRG